MADWNRDEDWELQRTYRDLARIEMIIQSTSRSAQLSTIRRIVPSFQDIPLSEFLAMFSPEGRLDLGEMAGRDARRLGKKLVDAGIEVVLEDVSFVSFLPINTTHGYAWVVEDKIEAETLAHEMIAEGVPVVEIET